MSNRKKKKRRGIIYFAPPVMVIVIGIIVYLIVLPSYGQGSIKICDLLMLNPRDMINTILGVEIIQTANSVAIDKIRVLDWIFIITFIVSLYFPGFYLHFRTSVPNENASATSNNSEKSTSHSDNFDISKIDMNMMMKISSLLNNMNSKNDPRSNLIYSLKPYLRDSKKEKIDQYANLLNLTKMADLFKDTNSGQKSND